MDLDTARRNAYSVSGRAWWWADVVRQRTADHGKDW